LSGLLTLGLAAGGVLLIGLLTLERSVNTAGPLKEDKTVLIPKSTGISEIAELLTQQGVIAQPALFELYAISTAIAVLSGPVSFSSRPAPASIRPSTR
jgi:UPF0755 protein